MKWLSWILVLLCMASSLHSSEFDRLKQVEEQGTKNPDLFYNLGVTYWQTGQSGMASLYFLKALNLDSAHRQARENLNYVIELSVDRDLYPSRVFLIQLFLKFYDSLNLNRMALITLSLLFLSALGALWYLNYDPQKERDLPALIWGISLFLLLVSGTLTGFKAYRRSHNRQAVVISEQAELCAEPKDDAERTALIHEALILQVRKYQGDWALVSLPDGSEGWLPKAKIAVVLQHPI